MVLFYFYWCNCANLTDTVSFLPKIEFVLFLSVYENLCAALFFHVFGYLIFLFLKLLSCGIF